MRKILIPYSKLDPRAKIFIRASPGAVGYDVYACRVLDRQTKNPCGELPVTIGPGEAVLIGTGITFAVPAGYDCQVRPRSGLASIFDIELSNSPGTVDPDFRGEIGILLRNRGTKPFVVEPDMRIAQLVFTAIALPVFHEVDDPSRLPPTTRDKGGFGSSGLYGIGYGTDECDAEVAEIDEYLMGITLATAARSNCARGCPKDQDGRYLRDDYGRLIGQTRRFGCIFALGDQVLASGFNAQSPGSELCAEVGCLRDAEGINSGTQIEKCRAVHAEQSAINWAARQGIRLEGSTLYVNALPCLVCARVIAGLGIEAVVVLEKGYSETEGLVIIQQARIPVRVIAKERLGL
ncbi:dUTP diphosphatase [Patescibacteria group bacterium]|nr:dUTP diphosphatase [Patescibacteria group bacterium]